MIVWSLLLLPSVLSLECFECNSRYDSNCGDPFDGYSIAAVDCDQKSDSDRFDINQASLCRKTTQYVEDDVRVIRSCGWVQNQGYYANRTCYNKPGTSNIQVYHCICEDSLCNGANSSLLAKGPILIILVLHWGGFRCLSS